MTNEKWHYLKRQAEKSNARFIRCDGIVYEVTSRQYPTGLMWSIDEVCPVDVPAFVQDPEDDGA